MIYGTLKVTILGIELYRDIISSMYVESDLKKMKNKRFWAKYCFDVFVAVFSKRVTGAQKATILGIET